MRLYFCFFKKKQCPLHKDLHIKFEQQDGVKVEVALKICPIVFSTCARAFFLASLGREVVVVSCF